MTEAQICLHVKQIQELNRQEAQLERQRLPEDDARRQSLHRERLRIWDLIQGRPSSKQFEDTSFA